MTRDIQEMSIQELEMALSELEDSYAELMGCDDPDELLNELYSRIRKIREELEARKEKKPSR